MEKAQTTHYYISAGSNVESARLNVERAVALLTQLLDEPTCSSVYSTPSASLGDDSVYCNAVVGGFSSESPKSLSDRLKEIESQFGRVHDSATRRVELDLDVVVAGDEILRPRDFSRSYFRIGYLQLVEEE